MRFFSNQVGKVVIKTCHNKYLIALPDGSLRADSCNPNEEWEQLTIFPLAKDHICDRTNLFRYLDQLAAEGSCFTSFTMVINQWNLGGVVRLLHHSCILSEASGCRHLKFDFGRWGIGWVLLEDFPEHPKGTCQIETFQICADPHLIKNFCLQVQPFSWTSNNCSSFTKGIMKELSLPDPSNTLVDVWPAWSYTLANPPVKLPSH